MISAIQTRFVSQVLFFKRLFIYAYASIFQFNSLKMIPLPNLGFFLAEFTSFQLIFRLEQSLWHFTAYQPYLRLGLRPVVSSRYCDLLIRHIQTLQASQLVEAWTFLYFCSNRFLRVYYILLISKQKTSIIFQTVVIKQIYQLLLQQPSLLDALVI